MSVPEKKSMSLSLSIPERVKRKAGLWAGPSGNHQDQAKCTTSNFWKAKSLLPTLAPYSRSRKMGCPLHNHSGAEDGEW